MKPKAKFLALLTVFTLLAFVSLGLAQKGGKRPPPQPSPTPSDPAIAYISDGLWGGNLMVMNADGSNQTMLLDDRDFENADPSWSPDGSQLVFHRYPTTGLRGGSMCVINKDGSSLRVLLPSDPNHYQFEFPRWSPWELQDGKYKILFSDAIPTNAPYDLFLVNLDGSEVVNLTSTPGEHESEPAWSPEARRIAALVAHPPDFIEEDIIVYDITYSDSDGDGIFTFEATNPTNLTDSGPLANANLANVSWAKTQDKILVSASLSEDPGSWGLWVIDLSDPSNPVRISQASSANPLMPSWSADDSMIVYRYLAPWTKGKRGQSGIYVMNADGTGATNEGYPTSGYWPEWRRCCPTCDVICAQ